MWTLRHHRIRPSCNCTQLNASIMLVLPITGDLTTLLLYPLNKLHSHMQMHVTKAPQQAHFIYLGNKEIYHIFKTCCIIYVHHHHHHHHITFMELGHLLTRSGLTYPEVSSKVYHDSFCQMGSSTVIPRLTSDPANEFFG